MRIQVFGAGGTLGRAVRRMGVSAGHLITPGPGQIENAGPNCIFADVVINCAGIVKQRAESIGTMMLANAVGPHVLAAAASSVGSRIIHVSTDCVFKGGGPHYEDGVPDADDPYARSKLAGEVVYGPHLTLRTSFVGFGTHGLIRDLQTRQSVTVSQNLLWTGHTVDTVALTLIWLAEHPHIAGLLHMPGTEQNRYTLARDLTARWGFQAHLERDDGFVADRRLASGRWAYLGIPTPPPFLEQLDTMGKW